MDFFTLLAVVFCVAPSYAIVCWIIRWAQSRYETYEGIAMRILDRHFNITDKPQVYDREEITDMILEMDDMRSRLSEDGINVARWREFTIDDSGDTNLHPEIASVYRSMRKCYVKRHGKALIEEGLVAISHALTQIFNNSSKLNLSGFSDFIPQYLRSGPMHWIIERLASRFVEGHPMLELILRFTGITTLYAKTKEMSRDLPRDLPRDAPRDSATDEVKKAMDELREFTGTN